MPWVGLPGSPDIAHTARRGRARAAYRTRSIGARAVGRSFAARPRIGTGADGAGNGSPTLRMPCAFLPSSPEAPDPLLRPEAGDTITRRGAAPHATENCSAPSGKRER